jgi:hypothetical protein
MDARANGIRVVQGRDWWWCKGGTGGGVKNIKNEPANKYN